MFPFTLEHQRLCNLKISVHVIKPFSPQYELENGRLRSANATLSEALAATSSASAQLTSGALEDDAALDSIERSFSKFHAFLDLLRDAGCVTHTQPETSYLQ